MMKTLTRNIVKTSFMENSREQLEPNDGIYEDDKDDQKGDVKQGDHGHDDTVQYNL